MWKRLCKPDKELMTNKERQDIELCAQKATLQQQRSHIEILESALNRAQMHINQVEEQVIEHQFKLIPSQSDSFFLGGTLQRYSIGGSAGRRGFIRPWNHHGIYPAAMCRTRNRRCKVLREKWPTWRSGSDDLNESNSSVPAPSYGRTWKSGVIGLEKKSPASNKWILWPSSSFFFLGNLDNSITDALLSFQSQAKPWWASKKIWSCFWFLFLLLSRFNSAQIQ